MEVKADMADLVSSRKLFLRGVDLLPWAAGALLLGLGLYGRPALLLVGSGLLVAAGLLYVAGASGCTPPRPGRLPIQTLGCWEVPQAFYVERRGHGLLFYRAFSPGPGALPEEFSVIAVPSECDGEILRYSGFVPPEDSRLLGKVPTRELRFDHRGGHYVEKASLARALSRIEAGSV